MMGLGITISANLGKPRLVQILVGWQRALILTTLDWRDIEHSGHWGNPLL
jgi:hypothetical protein